MNARSFFGILLALGLAMRADAAGAVSSSALPWHLVRAENGVEVYARDKVNSKRKDFKAVVRIPGSQTDLLEVIHHVEKGPEWMHMLNEAKTIRLSPEEEPFYYFVWQTPWPFPNRDMVSSRETLRDPETQSVTVQYRDYQGEYPEQEGRSRVTRFDCTWIVKPLDSKNVEVSFIMAPGPEGPLPAVVTNRMMRTITEKSIENLRNYFRRAE